MTQRLEVQTARPFAVEPLEPRVLLNGVVAVATGPPAAQIGSAEIVVAPRPEVIHSDVQALFGDVQNLETLEAPHETTLFAQGNTSGSQTGPNVQSSRQMKALQANAADPAKIDCFQPLADGSYVYLAKVQVLAGDVTTVDLSGRGLNDLILKEPGPTGQIDKLPDWQTTLASTGTFLFVPKLPAAPSPSDFTFTAETAGNALDCDGLPIVNGTQVQVIVTVDLRDGYSVMGQNAVTFGTLREDVLRQQQRLAYFGFPGTDGSALVVDGITGQNTQWASELFNAAVIDKNVAAAPATPLSDYINARNAPRWVEIVAQPGLEIEPNDDGTPQSETWATSWAKDVLQAALQTYRAAHPDGVFPFKGASLEQGGPSAHLSHQAGMDVDIDIPNTTNSIASPWYVTRTANGVTYVAANTGNKDIVWQAPNGTYKGAAEPAANGTLPAGLAAGSKPVLQDYAGVYDNQAVLRAINDAGLFVLNPNYDRADAKAQIDAFLAVNGTSVSTSSGATTRNIYYNDPALWGLAPGDPLPVAANLDTPIVFTHDHAGHFHVNIKAPALVSDGLSATETDSILQGLGGLDEWIRRLEVYDPTAAPGPQGTIHGLAANTQSYALGTGLPFIGQSLGQLLGLSDIVNTRLIAPVRSYFAGDQTPSVGELGGLFSNLSFSAGGLTVGIDPQKSSVDLVHLADHDEVRFNLDLQAKISAANLSLLLPAITQSLGVNLDDSVKLNASAAVDLAFSFGVNLGANVSAANAFFANVKKLDASIFVEASGLQAAGKIAGITVAIKNGSAKLGAGVSVSFGQGRLTLADLQTKPLSDLVKFSATPITASLSLPVSTSPFSLGGLDVSLTGLLMVSAHDIDYSLTAALQGNLLPRVEVKNVAAGTPSTLTLSRASGLQLHARLDAFGVLLNVDGKLQSLTEFSITAASEPFMISGTNVTLRGTVARHADNVDFSLSATVSDWRPVSFITVNELTVTLGTSGLGFETTASIAGVNGIKLKGDYDTSTSTYFLAATLPVNWTLISGVNLSDVAFSITNRSPSGSAGDISVAASGHLHFFGTNFDVHVHVTPLGVWAAAIAQDRLVLVPGLSLDSPVVVITTYDFVIDSATDEEVPSVTAPQNDKQRKITTGVNLIATTKLPDGVPGLGGSNAEISGSLGTELSQMALEAKVVFAHPPEIAGLLAFDSIGVRITGDLTLTVFGDGRVLHEQIPGLSEDIAVRAGLTLDIVHTTLKGSLSLLHPLHNFFGIEGLNILEGDGTFGINFGTTPLPLPTVGFNFSVELPPSLQDILQLPPRLSAALNISSTEPILAMSVQNWQPLAKLGLSNLEIKEGSIVIAPNGGTIGLHVFPRGFSAIFIANLFGTDVDFEGRFDEQTKGIALKAYVSSFSIAGVNITGAGPDLVYQDGKANGGPNDPDNDNGAYFEADLTAQKQLLAFSGRVNLPGKTAQGQEAFIQLDGKIDTTGVNLSGQISNWNVVPEVLRVSAAKFNASVLFADIKKGSVTFSGDLTLLQAPIHIDGVLNSKGVSFDGSLATPGSFAGLPESNFKLSFSTLPDDQHFFVQFDIDLPGSGGVTTIRGAFQNQTLVLDSTISQWQPVPGITFNGALHSAVPLSRVALDLNFDVTGAILGASAHFTGTLSAAPNSFRIFATSDIALKLPNGQKIADLEGTIDLGKDSPFQIGLAGDFPLPGTQPATAHLRGSIGAGGITLFGTIDDRVLVPGLSFDGLVKLRFKAGLSAASIGPGIGPIQRIPVDVDPSIAADPLPSSTKNLTIQIDVSTKLLGSNLRLLGKLTGNGSNLDFDLTGHVRLTGPLVAGVILDLDASVVTESITFSGKTYRLQFSGDLQIFNGFDAVHITATMQGDSKGNWSLTVQGGVGFNLSATIDDIISLSINASINGTLTLRSNAELSFGLSVNGSARARGAGFDSSISLGFTISVDISAGTATIPRARPKVDHNQLGIATGISWHDYVLNTPTPSAPTPTVTATFIPSAIRNRPGTVQVRGTNAPEQINVIFLARILSTGEDSLVISGATGSSPLVHLLTVSVSSVSELDIDMSGGNDVVNVTLNTKLLTVAPRLHIVIRGGLGSDTITTNGLSATVYGNRDNATDDSIDGADIIVSGGSADAIFGGGGNDLITTTGGNAGADGGTGYNIINGTLLIQGSEGADHISANKNTTGRNFLHDPFGTPSASALLIQNVKEQGPAVTLTSVPIENVSRIQIEGLGGNDTISVAPEIAVPTTLNGGDGNDLIQAGSGPATINGGNDSDTLRGGAGNDIIQGGDGDDEIFTGGGTNTIDGGAGKDMIHAGAGATTVQVETADFILNEGGTLVVQGGNAAVTNVTINGGAAQRSQLKTIALQFNRDLSASLAPDDLEIVSSTGEKIAPSSFTLAWNPATNTGLITFTSALRDGVYTLSLKTAAVTDGSGNTLAADFSTKFFALAGDVNGDGRVNSLDLLAVSREIGQPDNTRDLTKDVNGDGKVDLADLTFIRGHFLSKTT